MKPGIYPQLPFEEYTRINAVNQSSLAHIDPDRGGCPLIYHWRQTHPDTTDTEALRTGRAFHTFMLEPNLFGRKYIIEDADLHAEILEKANAMQAAKKQKLSTKFSKNLTAWKDYVWLKEEDGIEILPESLLDKFAAMERAIRSGVEMREVLGAAIHNELSIVADLEDDQGRPIRCKCRIDTLTKDNEINDLKTIEDIAPKLWGPSFLSYRLDIQAAMCTDMAIAAGIDVSRFSWTFAGKSEPYQAAYWTDPSLVKTGRRRYKQLLSLINDGRETGEWPGHSPYPEYPPQLEEETQHVA